MKKLILAIWGVLIVGVFFMPAGAFMVGGEGEGCGAGECKDCHALSMEEAKGILKDVADDVIGVRFSEVGGLWEIDILKRGRKYPLYLDYSKQYVISGQVVKLATRENLTQNRFRNLNKIDISKIPLGDAVVVGSPRAKNKVIVFDDPVCPFCKKIHGEMKKVVAENPDIAFFIKMFPLVKIHPDAYDKAKAIVCSRSGELLEKSLNKEDVPPATCETDQVDKNIALGASLGIRTTPTLVLPDGMVVPGYKKADAIVKMVRESTGSGTSAGKEKGK